LLQTLM
jgi:hypothetical protein